MDWKIYLWDIFFGKTLLLNFPKMESLYVTYTSVQLVLLFAYSELGLLLWNP